MEKNKGAFFTWGNYIIMAPIMEKIQSLWERYNLAGRVWAPELEFVSNTVTGFVTR